MKKLDLVLAWVMVILGVLHMGAAWIVIKGFAIGALWGFVGGVAILEAGMLNVIRQSSSGFARAASIISNILIAAVLVSVGWSQMGHLIHHLHYVVILVVVAVELVLSIKG